LYILERISYRFASAGPAWIPYKPTDIKVGYKAVLLQMGVYIPSAPVEEKGYKRMINLPDWLNIHNIFIKLKNGAKTKRIGPLKKGLFFQDY
jgi:hypothetical protein